MTTTRTASRLTGRFVSREALEARERDTMFALLGAHFDGVRRETFESDLSEKNWIILLEDDRGVLRGFSTLLVYRTTAAGCDAAIVYSGDTIVERAWWGSTALPMTWLRAVRSVAPDCGRRVYWLLLTSGYRTYRFLPVFFREFHPTCEHSKAEDRLLLDRLATERFGPRFDRETGIVRFERPQVLVAELLDVPDGRRSDRHVAFFLERNPGYVRGDELVCLTRIGDDNLTPAARRFARSLDRQRS